MDGTFSGPIMMKSFDYGLKYTSLSSVPIGVLKSCYDPENNNMLSTWNIVHPKIPGQSWKTYIQIPPSRPNFVHYTESSQTFSIPDFCHRTIDGDHHSTSHGTTSRVDHSHVTATDCNPIIPFQVGNGRSSMNMNANETLKNQTSHNMSLRPTDSSSSKIKSQPAEHPFVEITFDATSGKLPTWDQTRDGELNLRSRKPLESDRRVVSVQDAVQNTAEYVLSTVRSAAPTLV
ncbi:hypothetical protein PAAG_08815 [Paracoccidioides lutzii Pb01]|uniref:Uncharacterized protein n=1 Tax=Paracoccidioides lutzii (strain ATCC MYA-826 / Pb01) TaxID=502779 RepID=C1HDH4_PARBA|nr:hypothetical protein PAAG_08815 [Paracoccidioides lutzii Pb01]EEH39546.2 hypothetical protein PAAG_08815 [Paracoccidioides lutzii Pb01]